MSILESSTIYFWEQHHARLSRTCFLLSGWRVSTLQQIPRVLSEWCAPQRATRQIQLTRMTTFFSGLQRTLALQCADAARLDACLRAWRRAALSGKWVAFAETEVT